MHGAREHLGGVGGVITLASGGHIGGPREIRLSRVASGALRSGGFNGYTSATGPGGPGATFSGEDQKWGRLES